MADFELQLLAKMTTAESLAHVQAVGLQPEVFEDPMARGAFEWVLNEYASPSGAAPTPAVYEAEFPSVRVPSAASVSETTEWLIGHLQRRHTLNRYQNLLRGAAKSNEDPVTALQTMAREIDGVLSEIGRTGKGFDDEFLHADQLDCLSTPEPLIADVLSRHAYGVLRGRDKSFKSFVALDWSLCLATGTPWQGKAVHPVRVLYVAGEGAHGIAARKQAWEEANGVTVDAKQFVVRRSAVNLYRTGPEFDHLLAYVRDDEFGLVVFDTLRRMSGGAEGNGSDMGVVVDNLDRIKRATAEGSVLAVAHTDKGDNDTRGFSGIEDDADVVWAAKREGNTNEVALRCEKFKDGPDGHQIDLRLRTVGASLTVESADATGNVGLLSKAHEADQIIMATMREVFAVDGATVKDIVEVTGLAQPTVYRSRARLLGSGQLTSNRAHRMFLQSTEKVTHA